MEALRINYLAQYPKQYCLILDNDPPTPDMIEGVDFVLNKIICERVSWKPEEIQLCLNEIKQISSDDISELMKLLFEFYTDQFEYTKINNLITFDSEFLKISLFNNGTIEILSYTESTINCDIVPLMNYFLMSKGYTIPFINLQIADLVEIGWLRLIH